MADKVSHAIQNLSDFGLRKIQTHKCLLSVRENSVKFLGILSDQLFSYYAGLGNIMVVKFDCVFVIWLLDYDCRLNIFEGFFYRFLLFAHNQIAMSLIKSIDYALTKSITSGIK